jgi:UDP-glucose 4-epimerase
MTLLSALPRATDPWSVLTERGDVVADRGILHLVHDDVSPHEAREADLLLVADALADAGIETLLVRHDHTVPALVVDVRDREAVQAALAAVCTREPLYVKAKGRAPLLACDAADVPDAPTAVRVYRPRLSRTGSLR